VAKGATCQTSSRFTMARAAHERGIFAINELPDLADRIQVGLSTSRRERRPDPWLQDPPTLDILLVARMWWARDAQPSRSAGKAPDDDPILVAVSRVWVADLCEGSFSA